MSTRAIVPQNVSVKMECRQLSQEDSHRLEAQLSITTTEHRHHQYAHRSYPRRQPVQPQAIAGTTTAPPNEELPKPILHTSSRAYWWTWHFRVAPTMTRNAHNRVFRCLSKTNEQMCRLASRAAMNSSLIISVLYPLGAFHRCMQSMYVFCKFSRRGLSSTSC